LYEVWDTASSSTWDVEGAGYVQWAKWPEGLQIECSSDENRPADVAPFTFAQRRQLALLGFNPPSDCPNFYARYLAREDLIEAAEVLEQVILEVLTEPIPDAEPPMPAPPLQVAAQSHGGRVPTGILSRVTIQPRGGGEPVESFDSRPDDRLEVDTLLSSYTRRFGDPIETAHTAVPGIAEPVDIGWVFDVPASFVVPGAHADFEMVVIPMIQVEGTDRLESLFVAMAAERRDFQALFDDGALDELHIATLEQRDADEPVRFGKLKSQKHDD
jgi:hypothetical protein